MEDSHYSVCLDCILAITYGDDACHDIDSDIERELDGRSGHFVPGECSDEFSWSDCELCRSTLAGSRHSATLIITEPKR